jgi:O-antigen/teichoic acid export membrane protein
VIGILIARKLGRGDETDGLLAAYGVFAVVVVAAQAIRMAILPRLARAADQNRLAGEVAGYAAALGIVAAPLVVVAEVWNSELGRVLTGGVSDVAANTAAGALRWMVPASLVYLFAGLAASGLAALDDYVTAAVGYAVASAVGLVFIALRIEPDGVEAVYRGVTLTAALALIIPALGLIVRALRSRMPASAVRRRGRPVRRRFREFAVGAALPIALQLMYLVSLPFAAHLGTGAATSFVYAYLAASSLVTVTAGALGLVTAVPLARREFTSTETIRHVVSASWVSLVLAGAAAGVFTVAGGEIVHRVLGSSYMGSVGTDVGRLVVALCPWIVLSVGVTVTFPLAFVAGRTRLLPGIALSALAAQFVLASIGVALLDLDGLTVALTTTTLFVLCALLHELEALAGVARGLMRAALTVGGLAVVAFAPSALFLGPPLAALAGFLAYVALILVIRPRPIVASWRYLRALG